MDITKYAGDVIITVWCFSKLYLLETKAKKDEKSAVFFFLCMVIFKLVGYRSVSSRSVEWAEIQGFSNLAAPKRPLGNLRKWHPLLLRNCEVLMFC